MFGPLERGIDWPLDNMLKNEIPMGLLMLSLDGVGLTGGGRILDVNGCYVGKLL